MSFRIAIDTGGTFTDIVVADEKGELTLGKAPSTLERSSRGVIDGLRDAARNMSLDLAGLVAGTEVLIYGTTWATNAIITCNTARRSDSSSPETSSKNTSQLFLEYTPASGRAFKKVVLMAPFSVPLE